MAKKAKAPKAPKIPKPRFGIGEWYGHYFPRLSAAKRKELSETASNQVIKKKETCPPCPFQKSPDGSPLPCTKKGGVCSLKLYDCREDGSASSAVDEAGKLVTVCPSRFEQNGTVFEWVGKEILNTLNAPLVIGEVRFLRRIKIDETESETNKKPQREDVGNIDNVLIQPESSPLHWCALEIQAVYFSGEEMPKLFAHVGNWSAETLPFPDLTRRPDFRSSGPKRLMPQLQIKVPTLRRWGKKMAVVVDEQFFSKLGVMEEIPDPTDISNCDIVWFVVGYDEQTDPVTLKPAFKCLTTLERAVEGLTNGIPVSLSLFEQRIREKLQEGS